jgi:transcriptional repressor NrdR|tara:strand:- start:6 stop:521 length:516 start_codon:yes stop_codon:yes gene_type:complete
MLCPHCGHGESKVIDSRDSKTATRRRRECSLCSLRYTTYEQVQSNVIAIVKRDGRREDFNKEKLMYSLKLACTKRPLPTGTLDKIVSDVESNIFKRGRSEISSKTIGEIVIRKLKEADRVAYIRYASVYKDFPDLETFKEELESAITDDIEEESEDSLQPTLFEFKNKDYK